MITPSSVKVVDKTSSADKLAVVKTARSVPLRTVLIVPFVLQIFAAVGIVGYLSFRNGQQAVNEVATQLRQEISDRISERVQAYMTFPHQLNQFKANAFELGDLNLQDTPRIQRHFWKQLQTFDTVSVTYIATPGGDFIAARRTNEGNFLLQERSELTEGNMNYYAANDRGEPTNLVKVKPKYDPRVRPWYTAATEVKKATWSKIYADFTSKGLGITAAQPLYNASGELQAVFGTDLLFSRVNEFLHQLKIGKSGQTFIIERSGALITTSTVDPVYLIKGEETERIQAIDSQNAIISLTTKHLQEQFGSLSNIQQAQQLNFKIKDQLQFLQVTPLKDDKGLDWLIVVTIPEADFLEQINANTRTTIWLCMAAFTGAIIVGVLTARWVTKPILYLNETAKNITKGQWGKIVEINRNDEVGELATSFKSMAEQLQVSFTEMQALNVELSESKSRLNQILEAIPVGIFVAESSSGKPYYINSRAKFLLGKDLVVDISPDQIREEYQAYLAGSDEIYPAEKDPILCAFKGSSVNVDDLEIHKGDRVIPIEAWGTPIYDEKGNVRYAIAAFADITQRKEAEKLVAEYNHTLEIQVAERTQELSETLDSLQATQNELIQSEKMAALGQLVAGVAHELNTPLGAIRSSAGNMTKFLGQTLSNLPSLFESLSPAEAEIFFILLNRSLQKDTSLTAKEERKLKRSLISQLEEENIDDADEIADTLVDMGIYEADDFLVLLQKDDRDRILEMAYKLTEIHRGTQTINTATDRASKVVFALKNYARYDSSEVMIQSDIVDGIETVLTLYQNNIKQGVEVLRNYQKIEPILCYVDQLNQVWTNLIHNALQAMNNKGTLIIDVLQEGNYVKVGITDSGNGIPPEIMPKIFEPFFTTKPPGEGSGLGLDIVKKIIEKHDGKIEVASVPGKTTFTVCLSVHLS